MHHNHSHFDRTPPSPPTMRYTLCFLGEPVTASNDHGPLYDWALAHGYALNAWGCLFTLMPGVTIVHR